jgi:hypothetical protein
LKDTENKGEGIREPINGNANSEYYTGNKSKQLLVHVMQDGLEVDKPVKTKIYEQSVTWNKRQWPIIPSRFYYDYNGLAHMQVDVNDSAVLTFRKDHEDKCKKCGGKMTIDTTQTRTLGRKGIFNAIWGLDSTHLILMIVIIIGAMVMSSAFVYFFNQDTLHKSQLDSANQKIVDLKAQLCQLLGNCAPPPTDTSKVDQR